MTQKDIPHDAERRASAPQADAKCERPGGGALGAIGIILLSLNLNAAVTSLPPIYDLIRKSFPISIAAQGVMGTLPLLCLAIFGHLTPRLCQRLGLERSALVAMGLLTLGIAVRAIFSQSILFFALMSVVAVAGIGIGNVLAPPLIRSLFPRHVPQMMGLYLVLIVIAASAPPVISLPIAQAVGWRGAAGCWCLLSFVAMLPWFGLLRRPRRSETDNSDEGAINAWRWPTSWAVATVFAVGMLNMYSFVAWLPRTLTETAGVTAGVAAIMLAVFNFIGMPPALLAPAGLTHRRLAAVLMVGTAVCVAAGALGIAYLPGLSWLWVVVAGLGVTFVPMGLSLIALRSRTHQGATALSGMVQSAGYVIAAVGPLLVGMLHQASGGWHLSFTFLAATGVIGLVAGLFAIRDVAIEDERTSVTP